MMTEAACQASEWQQMQLADTFLCCYSLKSCLWEFMWEVGMSDLWTNHSVAKSVGMISWWICLIWFLHFNSVTEWFQNDSKQLAGNIISEYNYNSACLLHKINMTSEGLSYKSWATCIKPFGSLCVILDPDSLNSLFIKSYFYGSSFLPKEE